jgi:hypothetical protein
MLPTESFAHGSGRTLVRAEYGYPKGSPITNLLLQLSIQCLPQCNNHMRLTYDDVAPLTPENECLQG